MVKTLIVTHGPLGEALLRAAQKIAGDNGRQAAVCLDWEDSPEAALRKVKAALADLGDNDGVLLLTDMFGGTPHNVACELREPGRVEVVSGVNLPMVVRLDCGPPADLTVDELADWIRDKGRQSISTEATRRKRRPAGVATGRCGD